ncbi:MAG: hypothetical protein WDZ28_02960 [Simkaniaceae bacterium]
MNVVRLDLQNQLIIDRKGKTNYSVNQKIATLIQELKEKGPMVGVGSFGPEVFNGDPIKPKNHPIDCYGWKADARKSIRGHFTFVVVGAAQDKEKAFVYYKMTTDITENPLSPFRLHKISDKKTYVTSFKKFDDLLIDLFPENEFINRLSSLDLGDGEKTYKEIGQSIFDFYKEKAQGNSLMGMAAAVCVCEALGKSVIDGCLRSQYVEKAWNGIGDSKCCWYG